MTKVNSGSASAPGQTPTPAPFPLKPVILDEKASENLDIYIDMLLAWKKAINLTGAASREKLLTDLIMDSFYLACFLEKIFPENWKGRLWDFGSGAGLPGIPLRIVWTRGDYTMIEAREKRALFLSSVLARLNLPFTRVFRGRAEKFAEAGQDSMKADCIISRAFMPWQKLLNFARPLLAGAGKIIIMENSPPPSPPDGWKIVAQGHYTCALKTRWIWAFSITA